jgi:hypothetical protein
MEIGDIVQNIDSKDVGLVIAKNRPQPKQVPFVYVLSRGQMLRWSEGQLEVIYD